MKHICFSKVCNETEAAEDQSNYVKLQLFAPFLKEACIWVHFGKNIMKDGDRKLYCIAGAWS